MKSRLTIASAWLALAMWSQGPAEASTLHPQIENPLKLSASSTIPFQGIKTDTSDWVVRVLSLFPQSSSFIKDSEYRELIDLWRTRFWQNLILKYETKIQDSSLSDEERWDIIEEFTEAYETFLAQMPSDWEIGSRENIRSARVSATGMFRQSISNFHPSIWGVISDSNIEWLMQNWESWKLWELIRDVWIENISDFMMCNVVWRENMSNWVDWGNCGSISLLQNTQVSSVVYIPEHDIFVWQMDACNGNFFVAFIPHSSEWVILAPQDAVREYDRIKTQGAQQRITSRISNFWWWSDGWLWRTNNNGSFSFFDWWSHSSTPINWWWFHSSTPIAPIPNTPAIINSLTGLASILLWGFLLRWRKSKKTV